MSHLDTFLGKDTTKLPWKRFYNAMASSSSTVTASTASASMFLLFFLTWQEDLMPTAIPHPERSNTAQGRH